MATSNNTLHRSHYPKDYSSTQMVVLERSHNREEKLRWGFLKEEFDH